MTKKIKMLLVFTFITSCFFSSNSLIKADQKYNDKTYKVYRISSDGAFNFLFESDDFNEANAQMKKEAGIKKNVVVTSRQGRSPLKVVAADRAYAQSYPYRKGKESASETLNIYRNSNLTNKYTYIAAHYNMNYYGTQLVGGRLVAEIEIQGARGFVEVEKTDLIPFVFVEEGLEVTLGGNENFYKKPEQPYKMRIREDAYFVDYNEATKRNELFLQYRTSWKNSNFSQIRVGIAPSWLPVGRYYSSDGVYFYTDLDLKNRVSNNPYYSYFQWLPVRAHSDLTDSDLEKYMSKVAAKDSVILKHEKLFITNGEKFSMHPGIILSQANLESAYGSSYLAKNRLNLFGWNAVDSNPGQAEAYKGIDKAISTQMNKNMRGYFSINDGRFYNNGFGNKGDGVATYYASDPYYGIKVGSLALEIDESANFKDFNKYKLVKLKDNLSVNVRKKSNTTDGSWYTTSSQRKNQVFINLGKENDFYKTILPGPVNKNKTELLKFDFDDNNEYAFDSFDVNAFVSSNSNHSSEVIPQSLNQVSDQRNTVIGKPQKYIVKSASGLRLRKTTSPTSETLTVLPNNQVLDGELMNDGRVKTTYGGYTGYVSYLYLEPYSASSASGPSYLPEGKEYATGDINGDGEVNMQDVIKVHKHVTNHTKLTGDELKRANVNPKSNEISMLDVISIHKHVTGVKLFD